MEGYLVVQDLMCTCSFGVISELFVIGAFILIVPIAEYH